MFQYAKSSFRERWRLFLTILLILSTIGLGYMGSLTISDKIVIQAKEDLDKNWRYQYDLLVIPKEVDPTKGLEDGWLAPQSSIASYGGISLVDLQSIRDIPGVRVAAPLSLLGYVEVNGIGAYYNADEKEAYSYSKQLTTTFDGLSEIVVYDYKGIREYSVNYGRNPYEWDPTNYGGLSNKLAGENEGWRTYMPAGFHIRQPNSLMVIAVDPISENQLYSLDDSLLLGNSLSEAEVSNKIGVPTLPFLALGNNQSQLNEKITIERIHVPEFVSEDEYKESATEFLLRLPRTTLVDLSLNTFSEKWRYATGEMNLTGGSNYNFSEIPGLSTETWVSRLTPITFTSMGEDAGIPVMKANIVEKSSWDNRELPIYRSQPEKDGPLGFNYTIIDFYDSTKITPVYKGSWQHGDPTEIYTPHHSMILKNGFGENIDPTPLLPLPYKDTYYTGSPDAITTIEAASIFFEDEDIISSIRVVVDGVEERTDASQLKVEKIAKEIMDRTGHQVQIMLGSSSSKVHIDLDSNNAEAAGVVEEGWQQTGVSWSIQEQIEKSNIILFIYLSIVSFIFCYTVITHSLLARSTDFAMLRAIGWSRRKIIASLFLEIITLCLLSIVPVVIMNIFVQTLIWEQVLLVILFSFCLIAIGYVTGSRKALKLSPRAGLEGEGTEWKFMRVFSIKGLFSYVIHQLIRRPLRFGLLSIVLAMTSLWSFCFLLPKKACPIFCFSVF
ncbi:hypothetical protein QNH10_13165 [Sporosarcina thermotolerans]|uniref:FtsX-like permease family protein n=1 Tax=Sporosarcina thermotolerans TaxID=633404 RepID=UPI0024BC3C91|nr:FtsX-like permease family protein [Sporosarcina thermotolerans]WHT47187.1 hypothetical protein QNH10_13165 [Sporosarcina thermotolerans]